MQIQQSILAELKGIRANTGESAKASRGGSSFEGGALEDMMEESIRLGRGSLREVIAETARSEG